MRFTRIHMRLCQPLLVDGIFVLAAAVPQQQDSGIRASYRVEVRI